MTKKGKCKFCGSDFHWSYQCRLNPKRGYTIKKKYEQAYKTGKTPKHDKLLSSQTLNRKRLIMELDKYCSLIVRISASNQFGILSCYTCGKRIPWKCSDCSHLISRQWLGTRFDFDNMRPCCQFCNRTLHGNLKIYRQNLTREIGEDRVNRLNLKKSSKLSTIQLEEILENIKQEYSSLVEKKQQK